MVSRTSVCVYADHVCVYADHVCAYADHGALSMLTHVPFIACLFICFSLCGTFFCALLSNAATPTTEDFREDGSRYRWGLSGRARV
jgi:hypothetical protein